MAAPTIQEILYAIGADVSDLQSKVGEVDAMFSQMAASGSEAANSLNTSFQQGFQAAESVGQAFANIGKDLHPEEQASGFEALFKTIESGAEGIAARVGISEQAFHSFVETVTAGGGLITTILEGIAGIALGEKIVESSISTETAMSTISRATGAAGERLADLREQFESLEGTVPQGAQGIATALGQVVARLDETGEAAQGTTRLLLQLATVTGSDVNTAVDESTRLFQAFGVSIEGQAQAANVLLRAIQGTGIGLGTLESQLVRMGPFLRQFGFSLAESASFISLLEKNGINAQSAMFALRSSFKQFTDAGLNAGEALRNVINAIKNTEDRSLAAAIAIQTFGSRGAQLVDVIKSGKFNFEEFAKQIETTGDTVEGAAARTGTFSGAVAKLGGEVEKLLTVTGVGAISIAFVNSLTAAATVVETLTVDLGKLAEILATGPSAAKDWATALPLDKMNILAAIIEKVIVNQAKQYVETTKATNAFADQSAKIDPVTGGLVVLENTLKGTASGYGVLQGGFDTFTTSTSTQVAEIKRVQGSYGVLSQETQDYNNKLIELGATAIKESKVLSEGVKKVADDSIQQGASFDIAKAKLTLFNEAVAAGGKDGKSLADSTLLAKVRIGELDNQVATAKAQFDGADESIKKFRDSLVVGAIASETATSLRKISEESDLMGSSFDKASGKASAFKKEYLALRDDGKSAAEALAQSAKDVGESWENIQIDEVLHKVQESMKKAEDEAHLMGPSFDVAGAKLTEFKQIISGLTNTTLDWSQKVTIATKAVGADFQSLQVDQALHNMNEELRVSDAQLVLFNSTWTNSARVLKAEEDRVSALQKTITTLLKDGLEPTDSRIKTLTTDLISNQAAVSALKLANDALAAVQKGQDPKTLPKIQLPVVGTEADKARESAHQLTDQIDALGKTEQFASFSSASLARVLSGELVAVQTAGGAVKLVAKDSQELAGTTIDAGKAIKDMQDKLGNVDPITKLSGSIENLGPSITGAADKFTTAAGTISTAVQGMSDKISAVPAQKTVDLKAKTDTASITAFKTTWDDIKDKSVTLTVSTPSTETLKADIAALAEKTITVKVDADTAALVSFKTELNEIKDKSIHLTVDPASVESMKSAVGAVDVPDKTVIVVANLTQFTSDITAALDEVETDQVNLALAPGAADALSASIRDIQVDPKSVSIKADLQQFDVSNIPDPVAERNVAIYARSEDVTTVVNQVTAAIQSLPNNKTITLSAEANVTGVDTFLASLKTVTDKQITLTLDPKAVESITEEVGKLTSDPKSIIITADLTQLNAAIAAIPEPIATRTLLIQAQIHGSPTLSPEAFLGPGGFMDSLVSNLASRISEEDLKLRMNFDPSVSSTVAEAQLAINNNPIQVPVLTPDKRSFSGISDASAQTTADIVNNWQGSLADLQSYMANAASNVSGSLSGIGRSARVEFSQVADASSTAAEDVISGWGGSLSALQNYMDTVKGIGPTTADATGIASSAVDQYISKLSQMEGTSTQAWGQASNQVDQFAANFENINTPISDADRRLDAFVNTAHDQAIAANKGGESLDKMTASLGGLTEAQQAAFSSGVQNAGSFTAMGVSADQASQSIDKLSASVAGLSKTTGGGGGGGGGGGVGFTGTIKQQANDAIDQTSKYASSVANITDAAFKHVADGIAATATEAERVTAAMTNWDQKESVFQTHADQAAAAAAATNQFGESIDNMVGSFNFLNPSMQLAVTEAGNVTGALTSMGLAAADARGAITDLSGAEFSVTGDAGVTGSPRLPLTEYFGTYAPGVVSDFGKKASSVPVTLKATVNPQIQDAVFTGSGVRPNIGGPGAPSGSSVFSAGPATKDLTKAVEANSPKDTNAILTSMHSTMQQQVSATKSVATAITSAKSLSSADIARLTTGVRGANS